MPLSLGQVRPFISRCLSEGLNQKFANEAEESLCDQLEEERQLAEEYQVSDWRF
jgi:hypothetical protein